MLFLKLVQEWKRSVHRKMLNLNFNKGWLLKIESIWKFYDWKQIDKPSVSPESSPSDMSSSSEHIFKMLTNISVTKKDKMNL